MLPSLRLAPFALLICFLGPTAPHAADTATYTDQEPHRATASVVRTDDRSAIEADRTTEPTPGGTREATILWHRHFDDAIYTSTGISESAGLVVAGNYWMSPIHVEATPLDGDGTADWTYEGGTKFYTDASRNGEVIAAIDFNDADSTATIMEWRPDSPTPLWSYVVHPCRSLVYQGWAGRKPIQVSDDGSTIAIAIVMYMPEGQRGRLYVFDPGNGTPATIYDFPTGNVVATAITPGGEFIAMAGWPNVYVYDRYAESLRWSGAIGSGNDALAISGNGNYLAWGWSTFYLKEWNGSAYGTLWTHNPGSGIYTGQCALSNDESTLAVSWDNGNETPNEVVLELYELPSLDLLWEYDYGIPSRTGPEPPRDHVDMPAQMLFSPEGEHLVVASWGGSFPELHVFEHSTSEPIFTLDTPGSIFDADVVRSINGNTYVSACGKQVHAGQGGRGGDLYTIEIPGSSAGVDELPTRPHWMQSAPNPFHVQTQLTYILHAPEHVHLSIYDVQGRLVRQLVDRLQSAGRHTVTWTGRTDSGTLLPSGIYHSRLQYGHNAASTTILLLR